MFGVKIVGWGPLKSITFAGVNRAGSDVYSVQFGNARTLLGHRADQRR